MARSTRSADVVINATFVHHRMSGVERYTVQLIEQLAATPDELEYVVLAHHDADRWQGLPDNFRVLRSPFRNRLLTDQVWIPSVLFRVRPSLVHYPAFAPPIVNLSRSLTTIHDAVFWRHPETLSRGGRWYYKPLLEFAAMRGYLQDIITISDSSRQDLVGYLGSAIRQVRVIPQGIDEGLLDTHADIGALRQKFKLPPRYLLAVGTLEPRKNIRCVIDAFRLLAERHPDLGLVLVGRHGWGKALQLDEQIRPRITITGAVEDHELLALYDAASAFVFPSLYEGFGLPLLEAMARGVPSVAAYASSLPEVGAEACLYADPHDPSSFATQIDRFLDDDALRREYGERGIKRASSLTWKRTAENTREVYRRILTQPVNLMGYPFAPLTMDGVLDELEQRCRDGVRTQVVTANVDFLVLADRNPSFRALLQKAELILADGMPLVWASRLLGRRLPERLAGSDLSLELCRQSTKRGFKLFFLGAAPGVALKAKENAEARFPGAQIVGTYSPDPLELKDPDASRLIVERINASGANVVLVAFGAPRQEEWIAKYREALNAGVYVGVGASIDFIAGRVPRAPEWMQRSGLEWLYRLIREPKRLWRRYLVQDSAFVGMFLRQWLGRHKYVLTETLDARVPEGGTLRPKAEEATSGNSDVI